MAVVFYPRFASHFLSPKQKHGSAQRTRLRRASFAVKMNTMSYRTRMELESGVGESSKGPAILWYKHDLRIDDHPGLLAASHHRSLVPLYVFDHRILSRLSNEMLELLLFALDDLRNSLKDQGSNLMIRFGNAEIVIQELVKEVNAISIYTEEEVEYELRGMLDAVKEISTLTSATVSSAKECPKMVTWSSSFYDIKNLEDLPSSCDDFKKLKLSVVSPILPSKLPAPEFNLGWGYIKKLRERESREGASFGALFRSALLLGIISRRRVHYEAIKYEKERNAGFLSPFGYSVITVAAAVNTVSSMEWYWLLALKSQKLLEGTRSIRIWRWNGYLVHYTVAGHEGPAVLFVHGFGAFWEHYRDNISEIAEGGNRVLAITLLGFGRSEKPNIIYTELIWAKLVRDFVIEVVGEPVHLVGNSIGGYFVAIVAGLWPAFAKSAVLLNSAGNVVPEYSTLRYSEDRKVSGAAWLAARLLLLYLRLNIRSILENFYPSKTERADDWLIDEMLRASHDPGVLVVLECIFSFDLSVPLNYLLEGFEKKILVVQGMRDPLSDSRSKLALLKAHCKGIVTREIDAGHCPHDERPAEVNSIIQEWVDTVEREGFSASSTGYKSKGDGGKAEFSTPV